MSVANGRPIHDGEDEMGNHELFIASLEKHGYASASVAWASMAEELGWSSEEVRLYAYRYFASLQTMEESTNHTTAMDSTGHDDHWTVEESVLFEALLVQHLPIIDQQGNLQNGITWEERIASQVPEKTPEEVRLRYETKYSQQDR